MSSSIMFKSALVKTSFFTGISTVVKVLSSFIINKVIAIYIGPSGVAIIGNFQNFISIISSFSTGGIDAGIVKYTSEYKKDDVEKKNILNTSLAIILSSSLILSLLIIVFHNPLTLFIFKNSAFSTIVLMFGFAVIFFSLNLFLLAVVNGHRKIKTYVQLNIISSIISLATAITMSRYYSLHGILYSLVLNPPIIFIISLFFLKKYDWIKFRLGEFIKHIRKSSLIGLSRYSVMALTTSLTGPTSLMIVRNYLAKNLSWNDAGYWEGVSRISSVYLLVITTAVGVYYLPRMAEITDKTELKNELFSTVKLIIPFVMLSAAVIYFLRDFIIHLLFTSSFYQMRDLFAFQLVGDVIKIASWLLSYIMVAKAMTRIFVTTEILFNATFVGIAIFMINKYGLIGVSYAYALNYTLYLMAMAFVFRNILYERDRIK